MKKLISKGYAHLLLTAILIILTSLLSLDTVLGKIAFALLTLSIISNIALFIIEYKRKV